MVVSSVVAPLPSTFPVTLLFTILSIILEKLTEINIGDKLQLCECLQSSGT